MPASWNLDAIYILFENSNIRTYRIMATVWVNGELKRIAFEMLACKAAADILEVETGTLVVLITCCRTLET